jgi:hypothetical protein
VERSARPVFFLPPGGSLSYPQGVADTFQTLIDTRARADEADHLARHVVAFLAEKGVISATPSEEGGFPRGPNALTISDPDVRRPAHETIPPVYSHLQVIIGRATHAADMSEGRPPKATCPKCATALEDPDEEWPAAVQAWLAGDDDSALACPACGGPTAVAGWGYESRFGFGTLAFRFWNWPPMSRAFLDELGRELGHPIAVVRGKL